MKKKWIAIVLLMTGAIVVCVFMSKRASYTSVLETNWRISLPYEANIKAPLIDGMKNEALQAQLNQKYLQVNKKLYEAFKDNKLVCPAIP